jgi:carbonic anhydrase
VIRNNGGRVTDPAATVASDVAVLRSAAAISPRISFSGHVYDIVTRRVETVISAAEAAQHRTHAPAAC